MGEFEANCQIKRLLALLERGTESSSVRSSILDLVGGMLGQRRRRVGSWERQWLWIALSFIEKNVSIGRSDVCLGLPEALASLQRLVMLGGGKNPVLAAAAKMNFDTVSYDDLACKLNLLINAPEGLPWSNTQRDARH